MYAAIGNGFGNWFCTFAGGYIFDYVSIFAVYLLFGILSIAGFGLTLYLMKAEKTNIHFISRLLLLNHNDYNEQKKGCAL